MKNPLNRLFFYGVFGLGLSTAMVAENYINKRNSLWEYVVGITLFVFSLVFIIGRIYIIKKNK
ncbi:MAG: hypothetical protein J5634_00210 [Bacilli bacterium]|nr:hypothetical protein [Bacilli bacterium]